MYCIRRACQLSGCIRFCKSHASTLCCNLRDLTKTQVTNNMECGRACCSLYLQVCIQALFAGGCRLYDRSLPHLINALHTLPKSYLTLLVSSGWSVGRNVAGSCLNFDHSLPANYSLRCLYQKLSWANPTVHSIMCSVLHQQCLSEPVSVDHCRSTVRQL